MQLYNDNAPFERIVAYVTGLFPETLEGNQYFLVVIAYFRKQLEVDVRVNQEAVDQIVWNWYTNLEFPWSYTVIRKEM